MIRTLCIGAIDLYQGYLSPLKGFSCAHRVLHGGPSCSQYVKEAMAEGGFASGWAALKHRARTCRVAMTALAAQKQEKAAWGGKGPRKRGGLTPRNGVSKKFCIWYSAFEGGTWCCILPFFN